MLLIMDCSTAWTPATCHSLTSFSGLHAFAAFADTWAPACRGRVAPFTYDGANAPPRKSVPVATHVFSLRSSSSAQSPGSFDGHPVLPMCLCTVTWEARRRFRPFPLHTPKHMLNHDSASLLRSSRINSYSLLLVRSISFRPCSLVCFFGAMFCRENVL